MKATRKPVVLYEKPAFKIKKGDRILTPRMTLDAVEIVESYPTLDPAINSVNIWTPHATLSIKSDEIVLVAK